MTTGEKLSKLRKEKNMSQIQLAEQLGVSRQAISKWESGTTMPGIDSLIEISNFFGVSIDYLVKDIEQPNEIVEPIVDENDHKTIDVKRKNIIIWFICIVIITGILFLITQI